MADKELRWIDLELYDACTGYYYSENASYLAEHGKGYDEYGNPDPELGIDFKDGDEIKVKWEDGTIEDVIVEMDDCGGSPGYTFHYDSVPNIIYKIHGTKILLPLDSNFKVYIPWLES